MEARSRRVGGGFPGYNGPALPRAMRSSRGRGESTRKASVYGGRAGFFELLATVAGQILQEDNNGEEQETLKLAGVKQKRSELRDNYLKVTESPVKTSLAKKIYCEPTVAAASCLNALREGIKGEEAIKPFGVEKKEGESADSAHMVVDKAYVSCSSPDEQPHSLLGPDNATARNDCMTVSTPEQKIPECNKQMTLSVSDNDENQIIKSDPESSLSSAVKHASDSPETHAATREPVGRLQVPKSEDLGGGEQLDDTKQGKFDSRSSELLSDMEIDPPKASFMEGSMNYEGHDPVSSTASEVTKPEPSSGEVTHLHSCLASREDDALLRDMIRSSKRNSDELMRIPEDVKPWKSIDLCGKEDEGESGVEVDDKSIFESRKPLKVTDVILGRLVAEKAGVECGFVKEQVLGNSRERILSTKDNNNCPSKRNLPENVAQKLKDSYAKGMRARKVVKMVKRSRVSNPRNKRKHADMEAAADSDDAQGKKAYYRGMSYTRQRTSRGLPAKRKRMVDGAPSDSTELHVHTSDVMELGLECAEGEPPAAAAKLRSDKHTGNGEHVGDFGQPRNPLVESACTAKAASVASSPTGKGTAKFSKKSNEPHVKLTIKSFTVPELSVDLPESATVSSLKRAVMDAAMNLLGGGLRVRVLLQGKKVPDEGATLAQVGISRSVKPDSLGFMLEPSPMPTSPTSTCEDPLLVLSRAAGQPSQRYPGFGSPGMPNAGEVGSRCPKSRATKISGGAVDGETYSAPVSADHSEVKRSGMTFQGPQEDVLKGCPVNKPKAGSNDRTSLSPHSTRVAAAGALAAIRAQADASRRASKNESELAAPAPVTQGHENTVTGSGAIILHPGMNGGENTQGLALVPVRQKAHSMDVSKRRVRRPFSVSEVEALVHAVEKLGTGRWRDVKLRAFDQAKHRTYVDLKDKWKTLVHTARIAPHQRRGEPVPQELLERVTHAHTYWTAQAAKQQAELDY